MALKPVKDIPSVVGMECAANTAIVAGDILIKTADGQVTSTSVALTSAQDLRAVAVAAEPYDSTWPGTLASSRILACYPAIPSCSFEALCSATPAVTQLDEKWTVRDNTVINDATSAEATFIIEEIVDTTAKKVIGRFASKAYSYGTT